jgi:DNA-binding XRE family transcriptional regulator
MATPYLERLAEEVQRRRIELKLGVEPAAKLAGVSKDTWKRVEAGLKVRDTTYAKIDQALGWALGSCAGVLQGREPLVSEAAQGDREVRITKIPKEELERAIGDSVQSAAIATRGDLTADDLLKLNRRVIEELRLRGVI